jgi:large subunit ribosomal protein L19
MSAGAKKDKKGEGKGGEKAAFKLAPVNMEQRKKLDLKSGDTVRVTQKIREGEKTRLQAFEGLVLARKHGTEAGATFTVRKVTSGVGVEKIFPLYSPVIDTIEVIRRAKVRRAKLYHIRHKAAKEISREMRRVQTMRIVPDAEPVVTAPAEAPAETVTAA